MEVLGYSERGLINSFFYELLYNNKLLLSDFLNKVTYPYRTINFNVKDAKVLIEQSFSDFGDSDALILLNDKDTKDTKNKNSKFSIFVEAKVKTSQRKNWSIYDEFKDFKKIINNNQKVSSSNLFTQLYYKSMLFNTIQSSQEFYINRLQKGIRFPKWSSKQIRKIGGNKVVLKAIKDLFKFKDDSLFVAIVPEEKNRLDDFFNNELPNCHPEFQQWDTKNWSYISWEQIYSFCKCNGLNNTLNTFDWNYGQIY